MTSHRREITRGAPIASPISSSSAGPSPADIQPTGYREAVTRFEVSDPPSPERLPDPPVEVPAAPATETDQLPWTLADLERMALESHPAVAEASARVRAARGAWIQAGLPPNARIGYSADEMGDEGSAGQQGGFVAQQFLTAGKRDLDRQITAWQWQRAQDELEQVRLRVLTDVRVRYYDVLIAQQQRELAQQLVDISQKAVQAAEALYKGAEVSQADPLRAQIEADQARITLEDTSYQYLQAWRRLAAVLAVPERMPHRLNGDLGLEQIADLSWDEELQRVLGESPERAAATAQAQASRWSIRRAYAESVPNVDLQTGLAHNNASGDMLASVTLQIPLPLLNRNQGQIQRARAQAAADLYAVQRLELDLVSRLADAFQTYQSARFEVQTYARKRGILDNARQTLALVRTGYEAGEFGVLDLLSAQQTYFQTNLAYLDSLRRLWTATMKIRGLVVKDEG